MRTPKYRIKEVIVNLRTNERRYFPQVKYFLFWRYINKYHFWTIFSFFSEFESEFFSNSLEEAKETIDLYKKKSHAKLVKFIEL